MKVMAGRSSVSADDKKSLENYLRQFVSKSIQIIIQSRTGCRASFPTGMPAKGPDWFNLVIKDKEEVSRKTLKILTETQLLMSYTINIQISLTTSDSDSMVLEVWSINMNPMKCVQNKIRYDVYHRMGMALKSLMSTTRAVSAYRVCHTPNSDYTIRYELYHGTPSLMRLGASQKKISVASVGTPLGTISIATVNRTEMLLSAVTSITNDLQMKENYFTKETLQPLSPSPERRDSTVIQHRHDPSTSTKTERPLSAEIVDGKFALENPATALHTDISSIKDSPHNKLFRLGGSSSDNTDSSGSGQKIRTPEKSRVSGALAPPRRASQSSLEEDVPFSLLLDMSERGSDPILTTSSSESLHDHPHRSAVTRSLLDEPDFLDDLMKAEEFDILNSNSPFAAPDEESGLNRLYQACQHPPNLHLLSGPSIGDCLDTLNVTGMEDELAQFEEFLSQLTVKSEAPHGSPV